MTTMVHGEGVNGQYWHEEAECNSYQRKRVSHPKKEVKCKYCNTDKKLHWQKINGRWRMMEYGHNAPEPHECKEYCEAISIKRIKANNEAMDRLRNE